MTLRLIFFVRFSNKILFWLIFSGDTIFIVTVWNKMLPTFLPQFVSLGCYENITTFYSGLPACAKVFSAILPQFVRAMCNDFITIFRIQKTDFSRHGKAMLLGSGGHQTDSKPASVL